MLTASQAAEFTIRNYLARSGALPNPTTNPWDPTAGLDVTAFQPTYTVNGGGGAAYAKVQDALAAAKAKGGTARVYISIAPGTYHEQVCVDAALPPITLYSTDPDATKTVIEFANWQDGVATNGANPCTASDKNVNAATLVARNPGFQAKNLTIQNSATVAQLSAATNGQAVALATAADQVLLDNVRVLSHQDTLYVDSPASTVSRFYMKNSYVAGDVDFIFGAATAVFDGCQIVFVSDRKTSGQPLAPDTDTRNPYGFLVINSAVTADAGTSTINLGRAWDHSCGKGAASYLSTCASQPFYPNGQATVMGTTIDSHVNATAPWTVAATTGRGYSSVAWACDPSGMCPANRFYEYNDR